MSIRSRRERQREQRRRLILDTAREIAESRGWDAVTTRLLSERIEYSQPVLYSHFSGVDAIVRAVALEGFAELADSLRAGAAAASGPGAAVGAVARDYLRFAHRHPAVYAAMFGMPTDLEFASKDTPEPLRAGFVVIRDALAGATGSRDLETRTEIAWSALHGLATLGATHRLSPDHADERLTLLVEQLTARTPQALAGP